jgi:FixJ family two-component response regulator
MTNTDGIIFVVDGDMRYRHSLEGLLTAVGYQVRPYNAAELLEVAPKAELPCCVILDWNPGTSSGLEVQNWLNREAPMPVIFLSDCGSVRMVVQAMKAGACNFLLKPIKNDELLSAVQSALRQSKVQWEERRRKREIRCRYLTLTPREQEVLPFVVRGYLNKQTAYELGTAEITIRIHRGKIMRKMKADSLADLIRFADRLGLLQGTTCGTPVSQSFTERLYF